MQNNLEMLKNDFSERIDELEISIWDDHCE
jgi:hypothetical protein